MLSSTHEALDPHATIKGPSDRSFGLTFAGVFVLIGIAPLWRTAAMRPWAFVVAGGFAFLALWRPSLLTSANRRWMRLGLLLGRIVNPIVMFLLYFLVLTPTAVVARWRGRCSLTLGFVREQSTYWRERRPPGPSAETMTQQF